MDTGAITERLPSDCYPHFSYKRNENPSKKEKKILNEILPGMVKVSLRFGFVFFAFSYSYDKGQEVYVWIPERLPSGFRATAV